MAHLQDRPKRQPCQRKERDWMSQATTNGKQLTPLEKHKTLIDFARDKLIEVAPKYMDIDRLSRLLLQCGRNPKILACTPESILEFSMKCAQTGLEPIGAGGCWPIPYGTTLTFIPDYRGLVHCATRAGAITSAFAEVVRTADSFDYELGLNPSLTHKPARGDRGELEAAYCVFQLPDGSKRFTVMDAAEIIGIRNRSRSANAGPWKTDEAEMWKKTVIRRAMKPFAGMSSALDAAIEADDDAGGVVVEKREPVKMPQAVAAPEQSEEPTKPKRGRPKKEEPEPADQAEDSDEAGPIPPIDPAKWREAPDGAAAK